MEKINDFTDLKVWQKSHHLVLLIYKVTKSFPREELYALVDQLRRAAVSVSSNIAEGFSRQTSKEKVQFYYMASGSVAELRNQILIARDLDYIDPSRFMVLNDLSIEVNKMIQGLIKSIKSKD